MKTILALFIDFTHLAYNISCTAEMSFDFLALQKQVKCGTRRGPFCTSVSGLPPPPREPALRREGPFIKRDSPRRWALLQEGAP